MTKFLFNSEGAAMGFVDGLADPEGLDWVSSRNGRTVDVGDIEGHDEIARYAERAGGVEVELTGVNRITDAQAARVFVMAGKALFTIKSTKTGQHFTMKVKAPRGKENDKPRFVSVLDHLDGQGGWSYLGMINHDRFSVTRKSPYYDRSAAPQVLAAGWFFSRLFDGQLTDQVELWHEGKCGRCGRRLTHPESIATGLGPECAGKQ